jgi:hypothetical protein
LALAAVHDLAIFLAQQSGSGGQRQLHPSISCPCSKWPRLWDLAAGLYYGGFREALRSWRGLLRQGRQPGRDAEC